MGKSAGTATSKLVNGVRTNIATGQTMASSVAKNQSSSPTRQVTLASGEQLSPEAAASYGKGTPTTPIAPNPNTNTSNSLPDANSLLSQYQKSGPLTADQMLGKAPGALQNQSPATAPPANPTPTSITPPVSPNTAAYNAIKGQNIAFPDSSAERNAIANANTPAVQAKPVLDSVFQTPGGQGLQGIMDMYQQFFQPTQQRESLTQEYERLAQSSGIEGINTDLMNTKNLIEGSEDMIRTEITKAGGFATERQVQAMTIASNKQLITNYNALLEARNAAEKHLDTMMQLSYQDRQMAQQEMSQKMNFAFQVANYQQQAQTNAMNQYNHMSDTIGYDGLLNSFANDPQGKARYESLYGLAPGGLDALAAISAKKRAQQDLLTNLDIQAKRAAIANAGQVNLQFVKGDDGKNYSFNPKTGALNPLDTGTQDTNELQFAKTQSSIDQVNGLMTDKGLSGSVGANSIARSYPDFNYFTGVRQNFVSGVEQLRSTLNLDALIKAKSQGATFGALSNQELQLLSNTATKLGSWAIHLDDNPDNKVIGYDINETDFKNELQKVNNFAKLDYLIKGGIPAEAGITINPDGSAWVQNWDGTATQIR